MKRLSSVAFILVLPSILLGQCVSFVTGLPIPCNGGGPIGSSVSTTFSAGATNVSFAHNLGAAAHSVSCINLSTGGPESWNIFSDAGRTIPGLGVNTDYFTFTGGVATGGTTCTFTTGGVGPIGMTGATGPTGPINLIGVAGSSQTVRARLNFIATSPIIITPADNPGTSSTDVTVALSTPVSGANGGTGVANTGFTINLGGNLVTSGAFATTLTSTATTNSTLPAGTHLLAPLDSPSFTTPVLGAATATTINNLTLTQPATAATLTLANNSSLITSGANSLTFTTTGPTNVTLPTSGTLGTGTVTSVSFTGGLISIANPTTTPALTVAGTSGGIPYFSAASTWASSAALGAGAVVLGGGAGVTPQTAGNLIVSNIGTGTELWTLYNPTASTGATEFRIRAGAGDASGAKLLHGYLNDGTTERWSITRDGQGTFNSVISTGDLQLGSANTLRFGLRTKAFSAVDGSLFLSNSANNDFGLLQLGQTTSGYPALKRVAATVAFRLADDSADAAITASNGTFSGSSSAATYLTATNCANAASPAVCGSAAAGAVAIPTGVTSVVLVVNTTAVTATSRITLTSDDSLTIPATTCNSTLATLVGGLAVTARTAATSFTITYNGTIATNPLCVSYTIEN